MKLSLCIATFNEEKNLHYPLDSAYDLVDEVVIVDGGSTDRTVEIAQSHGKKVRIIKADNEKMFHKNKQKAIEAARGDWILQLDADEELSKELREEIMLVMGVEEKGIPTARSRGVLSKRAPTGMNPRQDPLPIAYWLPRKNFFLTRFLEKGGQYPDYTIRLYKNGVAKFPCKDVHENVEIIQKSKVKSQKFENSDIENSLKNENCKLKIGHLKNPLLHYADPDFSRYLMRWDRYTTLEAELLTKTMKQSNNETMKGILMFLNYFIIKPKLTFLSMYFRHKGFMDGFPGFIFALFSSLRFIVIYVKWWVKSRSSL